MRGCERMNRPTMREFVAVGVLAAALAVGVGLTLRASSPEVRVLIAPARATGTCGAGPVKLDLNTATVDELVLLPGIGPVRARAIVADRARRGAFSSVESLSRVHGIGPVTVERVRPHVVIGGEGN